MEVGNLVRRHITALRVALMALDAVAAMALFVIVSIVRFGADAWMAAWASTGTDGAVLAGVYAAGWVGTLWLFGLYRLRARWSARAEAFDVARAVLLLAVGTFSVLFWFKLDDVSRQFLIVLFPAQLLLTVVSRIALRVAFSEARGRGLNSRQVLIIGTGPVAVAMARRMASHPELGLRVIGFLATPEDRRSELETIIQAPPPRGWRRSRRGHSAAHLPILGSLDDILRVFHTNVVDEIAICLPSEEWALVEPITRLCEDEGKIVRIPVDDLGHTLPGARIEDFDGVKIQSLAYGPDRVLSLFAKRAMDVTLAVAGAILLSPVLLVISAAILVIDGRPILFRQTRIGLHGRPFSVVKFRTMVHDAESRLIELEPLNEIRGPAFKVTGDPRISRTGRILRRLSLDELPQVWNVLRGQMSIVGPRPPLPVEVEGYDVWHRRRLSMKPGITGLWQVAARREPEFDRWVRIDLEYIDRWSLWLDLKIIARTIPAVIAQEGR
jgi:exopolysaccharide biosynthesis polyprenyl glycosylphosphotransferase